MATRRSLGHGSLVVTVVANIIIYTGRLLIAIFVVSVSGILFGVRRAGDRPRRLPVLEEIGLVLVCWLAVNYAGFSPLVAIYVVAVGGILVSLVRAGDHPRRLPVIAEIGLVLLCWLAVAYAGLNLVACGLGDDGATGIRVCSSMTATNVYAAVVVAAAAIPLITVVISHVLGRRRVALTGGLFSFALVAAAVIWGSKNGVRVR